MNTLDEFGVLMNRDVVDEGVFDIRANRVPLRAIVLEPAQDQRMAQDDLDGIVVEHFFADGDHVGDNVRIRIPTGPERVGDDARSFAGRDEKKVVAEVLNRRINTSRIGKGAKAVRDIRVAAGGVGGRGNGKQ